MRRRRCKLTWAKQRACLGRRLRREKRIRPKTGGESLLFLEEMRLIERG